MNNAIKLTIIIPVYNQEKFLSECIESILKQNYNNLEVLLIDDGSTDSSPQICDDYCGRYQNIRVIHKENTGAGLSRNVGLKNAKGKYIFFLDADDCIDGIDTLSEMINLAEEKQSDIVVGCYKMFKQNWVSETNYHHLRDGEYTKTFEFRFNGFYRYGHLAYNCIKLYRTEFLTGNNIYARSYPIAEDKAQNMLCYAYGPRYSFYDKSCYLYRINEGSATFRYLKDFIKSWTSIAKDFCDEIKQRHINCNCDDLPVFHIFFGTFFLIKQELPKNGYKAAVNSLKQYMADPFAGNCIRRIIKEKYADEITDFKWRIAIKTAARVLNMHLYKLYVGAVFIIRFAKVDRLVTKFRYKKK